MRTLIAVLFSSIALGAAAAAPPVPLRAGFEREVVLEGGGAHDYSIVLARGESAQIVVRQQGVDVAIDVRSPGGTLIDTFDSPNGREGDEPVELFATERGAFTVTVRPFDQPTAPGKYTLRVVAVRDRAATRELLNARRAARLEAAEWLRARAVTLDKRDAIDSVAPSARVIGLGEATHGSREFADLRLALTRRLVADHGFRIVAVELSVDRAQQLEAYVNGDVPLTPEIEGASPTGWIGVRSVRQLVEWLREWNLAHRDDRVTLVGVDTQDNASSRAFLRGFVARAYPEAIAQRWTAAEQELARADEQASVFGDSSVSAPLRNFLFELRGAIELDSALLRSRFGQADVDRARKAADVLAQFADYNAGVPGARSRDWYMAANVLDAMHRRGDARTVYWAHNAHVAARRTTTGGRLRDAIGCAYAGVGMTFGEGAFIAQLPNDPANRVVASTLGLAEDETIDAVLGLAGHGAAFVASWPCEAAAAAPAWLQAPQRMHWIGGLYRPGSLPREALRPFDLLRDFRAIAYIPKVTAEDVPER